MPRQCNRLLFIPSNTSFLSSIAAELLGGHMGARQRLCFPGSFAGMAIKLNSHQWKATVMCLICCTSQGSSRKEMAPKKLGKLRRAKYRDNIIQRYGHCVIKNLAGLYPRFLGGNHQIFGIF